MLTLIDGFTAHHRTLDAAFDAARDAIENASWDLASEAFQVFRAAIERHMATEEAYLFPAYEKHHGVDNPLTAILRKGHRDLKGFFTEISEAISAHDSEEASALMGTVAQILGHHDEKEETEFYPAVAPLIPNPEEIIAMLA
ncbi:MAG TPA: hemerythrin domain-containing protein [Acidiferrobacter sp.]|nr:hemerythrin domain-containing protein [Acidiferrobacter sp.]